MSGRSRKINVTEEDAKDGESGAPAAGQAGEAKEEEFDDFELRYEFCARVLITTQLAEGK